MKPYHQMQYDGCQKLQPNLRAYPIVYDPSVTSVMLLFQHYHNDHIDPFFAKQF